MLPIECSSLYVATSIVTLEKTVALELVLVSIVKCTIYN